MCNTLCQLVYLTHIQLSSSLCLTTEPWWFFFLHVCFELTLREYIWAEHFVGIFWYDCHTKRPMATFGSLLRKNLESHLLCNPGPLYSSTGIDSQIVYCIREILVQSLVQTTTTPQLACPQQMHDPLRLKKTTLHYKRKYVNPSFFPDQLEKSMIF